VKQRANAANGQEISVLVVEDDAIVRSWVRLSFQGTEFRIAGETASTVEAMSLVERRRPLLLLVDHFLADGLGTKLVRELRNRGTTTPAVIMTAQAQRGLNEFVREAGAQGSVVKTGKASEFVETLRSVVDGRAAFDSRHPERPSEQGPLTPRERQVITLVAAGATNAEVAGELEVSIETVKTLLERTFRKLGVRRRAEAVAVAQKRGLV
jgi:two-component system response regulator DevR